MKSIIQMLAIGFLLSGCATTPGQGNFWANMADIQRRSNERTAQDYQQAQQNKPTDTNCTTTYYGNQAQTHCRSR